MSCLLLGNKDGGGGGGGWGVGKAANGWEIAEDLAQKFRSEKSQATNFKL